MDPAAMLDLAKQIFVFRVALTNDWDRQAQARDAMEAATQFYLAVAAATGQQALVSESTPAPESAPAPPPAPDQPVPVT